MIIVSACLLGLSTRYDGQIDPVVAEIKALGHDIVPVCPEQLGGLATPRSPSTIFGGDGHAVLAGECPLRNREGKDTTACFLLGARQVLRIARMVGATRAVLREKSPSCGVALTNVDWHSAPGAGVTAALLADAGIEVIGVRP